MIFKSPSVNDFSHLEQASGVLHAVWKCHSSWMSCHIWNRQMTFLLCGSFHDFQITTFCEWFVTIGTGKWLLSCVIPFVLLQLWKRLVTFGTSKQHLSCVGLFMRLQITTLARCLDTFGTGKWLLSCVGLLASLQITTFSKWFAILKLPLTVNDLPHLEQANGFSPV